jgi:hypothetical protein
MQVSNITRPLKKIFHFFHFGPCYAFWQFLYECHHKFNRSPGALTKKNRHKAILSYLSSKYSVFFSLFHDGIPSREDIPDRTVSNEPAPLWLCWWQGADSMPPLITACYNSVCRYADDHPVNLVTKDNYRDFVAIPDIIIKKLAAGIITLTHFSDILRMELLYRYGGMWIDATVFITRPFQERYFGMELFSLRRKQEGGNVSFCRWTAFLFSGIKHAILFRFVRDFFREYWKKETSMPDYNLIDYVIAAAYNAIPVVKTAIDNIPFTNPHLYYLTEHLNCQYNKAILDEICTDTCFHKLSRKKHAHRHTENGELTFYGFITKDI